MNSDAMSNYDKYVVDSSNPLGDGRTETPLMNEPNVVPNQFGQVKYAKRAGAQSIYMDKTRNTENDELASEKTMSGPACDYNDPMYDEAAEESQGI